MKLTEDAKKIMHLEDSIIPETAMQEKDLTLFFLREDSPEIQFLLTLCGDSFEAQNMVRRITDLIFYLDKDHLGPRLRG